MRFLREEFSRFAAGAALAALLAVLFLGAQPLKAEDGRIFELRIYTAHEGKLDALHQRFREHTNHLFVKHGMNLIGYWTPTEEPDSENTLVYILAYPSREAREASWKAFLDDPVWKKAYKKSIEDGKLVKKVVSTFLSPTDYSPIH